MPLKEGDYVVNNEVLRDLSPEDLRLALFIKDFHILPDNQELIGFALGRRGEPDVLLLDGELQKFIITTTEKNLHTKFEPITEDEKIQLREILCAKGFDITTLF